MTYMLLLNYSSFVKVTQNWKIPLFCFEPESPPNFFTVVYPHPHQGVCELVGMTRPHNGSFTIHNHNPCPKLKYKFMSLAQNDL